MTPGSEFVVVPNTTGVVGSKIDGNVDAQAAICDPTVTSCVNTQELDIEVSQERGITPRSLTARKGLPVELVINDKVPLGGCMSIWVIPKYGVTIPIKVGISKAAFIPTETGVLNVTCSMGSVMTQINVTD